MGRVTSTTAPAGRRKRSRWIPMVVTLGLGAAVLTGVGQSNTPAADAAPAGPIEDAQFDEEHLKGRMPGSTVPIPEGHVRDKLHVKFTPESGVRIRNGRVSAAPGRDGAGIHAALQRIGGTEVDAVDDRPADQVVAERAAREARSGEKLPDLSLWHELDVPEDRIEEVLTLLNASDLVELAYAPTELVAPADPRRAEQFHRRSAAPGPGLLDVEAAHTVPGGRGERVAVTDLELENFNLCHEDLIGRFAAGEITRLPGTPDKGCDRELDSHGTGAVGYIAAQEDNGTGMTGIAPRARIRFGSLNGDPMQDAQGDNTPTMVTAINASLPGDVILMEFSAPGGGPIEVNPLWHNVILTATAAGVIVVQPAGNQPVDIDALWKTKNPTKTSYDDSGAIMVGGGIAPPIPNHPVQFCRSQSTERAPDSSSGYGNRVDVQAWYWCGATLGTRSTEYNPNYGGTSGASAMIAGTVASLSSVVEERTGLPLNPYIARSLLKVNGRPQLPGDYLPDSAGILRWNGTAPTTRNVGPAPDLGVTIDRLDGAVAAGGSHTLTVRPDGTVWSWGANNDGQLGNQTTSTSATPHPVPVVGATGVLPTAGALAAGTSHSVALRADGRVYTWGRNAVGELGRNTSGAPSTTAQPVPGLANVVQVSAGGSYTLALRGDGTVAAWGDNSKGQLGNGTRTNSTTPVTVSNLRDVVAVSAGPSHALAVTRDGSVYAWGDNTNGQLGDGSTTARLTPVLTRFGRSTGLNQLVGAKQAPNALAAGRAHTAVLRTDGTVWTAGTNSSGQLGDGTTTTRTTPVRITSLSNVTAVAAAADAGYAVIGGAVRAWGANANRQLGDTTSGNRTTPGPNIAGLANVIAVEAGTTHVAATSAKGVVSTWGANGSGQVGGSGTTVTTPYVVPGVETRSPMAAVSPGGSHSLAVTADGSVYAWGANNYGQLGISGVTSTSAPTKLAIKDVLVSPTAIAAGADHSVVVKKDGSVWAWGANNQGQLGNGPNTAGSTTPVPVSGLSSGVVAVSSKANFTLALKADGTVWAWGSNNDRTLGSATTDAFSRTPVQVPGPANIKAIAAGNSHSVAVTGAGTVWAWGSNNVGQLGTGNTTARTTPALVAGLTDVSPVAGGIAAGLGHTVVVKRDGSVWTWGYNNYGQLGSGDRSNRSAPYRVGSVSGVRTVAATLFSSFARRATGAVSAWGGGLNGVIGDGATTDRLTAVTLNVPGTAAVAGGHHHAAAIDVDGMLRMWGNNGSGRVGVATTGNVVNPTAPTNLATLRPRPTP